MDIKASGYESSPVVPTQKLELPVRHSQKALYPPLPPLPDEIIDYVEIRSNNYQPMPTPPSHLNRTDRSSQDKGTLIDVWI